jgi:hypothetical protein
MTHPLRPLPVPLPRALALAVSLGLLWSGCSGGSAGPGGGAGGDGGGTGGASADGQACRLLKSGPFAPVMGQPTYTFSTPAPPVQNDAKAYRISLPSPSRVGHVSFKVPAAGEWVLYTSRSLSITVFTWDGSMIATKTVADHVADCTEVKGRESFDLMIDSRAHVIRFGPDSGDSVDLVVTAASP